MTSLRLSKCEVCGQAIEPFGTLCKAHADLTHAEMVAITRRNSLKFRAEAEEAARVAELAQVEEPILPKKEQEGLEHDEEG